MYEFSELDPFIAELCAEFAPKKPEQELVFSDEYCTSQCEFFNVCKANHDACIKCAVEEVLKTLSDRECRILKWRCGYEGKVRTQKDLGLQFNVTTTRIQEIERKALRKLRHPFRIKKLQPLMYTALSCGKDNFYSRLFTKAFKLNQEEIQNILNAGPFVGEKEEIPQPTERTRKAIPPASSIESLELSIRSYNCLWRAGLHTIEDLLKTEPKSLLRILWRKSLMEVCEKLEAAGFREKVSEIKRDLQGRHATAETKENQTQTQEEITSSSNVEFLKLQKEMVDLNERLKRVVSDKVILVELKAPEYMTYTNGHKGVTIFANLINRTNAPFKVKLQEFTLTHCNTQKVSDYNYVGYDFDEGYLFPDTIKAIGKIWVTEQWEDKEIGPDDYCVIVLKPQTSNKQYYYKFIYNSSGAWKLYDYYELIN